MNFSPEHNIPWDLIALALQGNLSREEELQLQQWISESDKNKELFGQLQGIWTEELNGYNVYQAADENAAWDALHSKMKIRSDKEIGEGLTLNIPETDKSLDFYLAKGIGEDKENGDGKKIGNDKENGDDKKIGEDKEIGQAKLIAGNSRSRRIVMMRWAVAAAVLIFVAGAFIWYNSRNQNTIYETGIAEERSIQLADGSTVKLYANSRIEVGNDYNKSARVIRFEKGEAFFDVIHNQQVPFRVEMGTATVKDIGTSFLIRNTKDSISVSVKTGEVAFTEKQHNETKELSAGMNLKYVPANNNTAGVILIDSSEAVANKELLHFQNTPLSEVILRFEKSYGRKLVLRNPAAAQKTFTANLEGVKFEEAINILSRSLNLEYSVENNVYYLK